VQLSGAVQCVQAARQWHLDSGNSQCQLIVSVIQPPITGPKTGATEAIVPTTAAE
jgi:hypothetical protein